MTRKAKAGMSLAVAGCLLGLTGALRAETVIGDWEGVDDGWLEHSSGDSIIAPPPDGVGTFSTIGVTLGTSSLKVVPSGNWDQNAKINLESTAGHPDFRTDFMANTRLLIDVTWNLADWTGTGSWAQLEMTINAAGIGWTAQGRPDADTGNPGYPGGWDPTNFGALHTRTMTWDYGQYIDGDSGNGELTLNGLGVPDYVQFIFTTNYDGNFTSAAYYFDNVRLSSPFGDGSWTGDTDNNWTTTTNWAGGVPNGLDHSATFGAISTGQYNVNVDGAKTLGTLTFNSDVAYALSGSTITFSESTGAPSIIAGIGSHTIAAPVTLNNWLFTTIGDGAQLNMTGPITVGPGGRQLSKAGGGLLQIEQINTGTISVTAGQLRVSQKPTANSASGTTVVNDLVISAGASLDLTNNSMVIDYATGTGPNPTLEDEIRQHLQNGRIVSSAAAGGTKLGYGDNAVLNKSELAGQVVDADSILIKFTYAGDANLDGQVTISDLGDLASNWQSTSAVWRNGDFNYDGQVTISDLGDLASNWQAGVGSPLGMSFQEALAAVGFDGAAVPEPATLGLLGLLGACTLKRARRSKM